MLKFLICAVHIHSLSLSLSFSLDRYRLQCDSFPSMYLFTKDLVTRLSQHFVKVMVREKRERERGGERVLEILISLQTEGFSLSVPGLPLSEYFDTIEQHHKVRK